MNESDDVQRYVESCQTEFWQKVFAAEIDYLVDRLGQSKDVLSVGCGPAYVESALSERGLSVTGLDISREALDRAPDGIRKVAASAEDMPFPESSFDAAIYVASLQFIEDYRKAIEQTARVLRAQGRLVVMLLNPESGYFKERYRDPRSYVRKIRHTGLRAIEDAAAEHFSLQTEYFLGLKGETIFESTDPADAALYVISGTKKPSGQGMAEA